MRKIVNKDKKDIFSSVETTLTVIEKLQELANEKHKRRNKLTKSLGIVRDMLQLIASLMKFEIYEVEYVILLDFVNFGGKNGKEKKNK